MLITKQTVLQETAGDISSLKSQLKDLGQQLVVLSGERERFYNENCKLKVDNERLCGEKELLIAKVKPRGVVTLVVVTASLFVMVTSLVVMVMSRVVIVESLIVIVRSRAFWLRHVLLS